MLGRNSTAYLLAATTLLGYGCCGLFRPQAAAVELPSGIYLWYQVETLNDLDDGATVTLWKDSGPNGFDLNRSVGSPTYVRRDVGQLSAVRIHRGFDDGLATTKDVVSLAGDPVFTLFAVATIDDQDHLSECLGWGNANGGAGTAILWEIENHRLDIATGNGNDAMTPNNSALPYLKKPTVYMTAKGPGLIHETSQVAYNGNSQPISKGQAPTPMNIPVTNFTLGSGGVSAGPRYLTPQEDFTELILYDRLLTANEQNQVGYYLEQKYGLDTDYTDPRDFGHVTLSVRANPALLEDQVDLRGARSYIRGGQARISAVERVVVWPKDQPVVYVFDHWKANVADFLKDPRQRKTRAQVSQDTRVTAFYKKMTSENLFVSTRGNDSWSGRLRTPNATGIDGPFATLERARDAIRETRELDGALKRHFTVSVEEGIYFLADTLRLNEEDSGGSYCPIIYAADANAKVTISGGRKLTDWKPYKNNIFQCALPGDVTERFRSLFYNGKRQIRARHPNLDADNPVHGGWAFMEDYSHVKQEDVVVWGVNDLGIYGARTISAKGSDGVIIWRPNTFSRQWSKPDQAEIFMFVANNWHNAIMPIRSVNKAERSIRLVGRTRCGEDRHPEMLVEKIKPPLASWWSMRTGGIPGARYRIENVLEELDQPGEWYVDMADRQVYLWPPENHPMLDALNQAEVIVPRLNRLINLEGTSHITFREMTFMHTNGGDNQHPAAGDGFGPMFPLAGAKYCGEAVRLHRADHCVVSKNRFLYPDGNGIYIHGQNTRNVIRENEIADAGASSIVVLGSESSCPMNNMVTENYIHGGGHFDKYSAGVFVGVSRGTRVSHNLIEDVPRDAISLGNNGYGRNTVEYNEIHRACREISEAGTINAWMEYSGQTHQDMLRSGHTIRYNLITDSAGSTGKEDAEGKNENASLLALGIFLDNDCCNCFIYGNIVLRCPTGMSVHGGSNNVIENNVFAECHVGIHWAPYRLPSWGSNVAERNIIYFNRLAYTIADGASRGSIEITGVPYYVDGFSDRVIESSDFNLIYNTAGPPYPICADYGSVPQRSFQQWQRMGYDRHSLLENPKFVDLQQDDYRLAPDSPAFKLGFQSIDSNKIGPQKKFNPLRKLP